MQARKIHRITAFTLAFLMLFTSIGYSVDLHYCKGELKTFSLVGKAKPCHQAKKKCPRHTKIDTAENNEDSKCCSNETIVIDDLDAHFNVMTDVSFDDLQFKFVSTFTYSYYNFSLPKVIQKTFLKKPIPPPSRDIYVLLERFLI